MFRDALFACMAQLAASADAPQAKVRENRKPARLTDEDRRRIDAADLRRDRRAAKRLGVSVELVTAAHPGLYQRLPTDLRIGDRVELCYGDRVVPGRFVLYFDDDDPDEGGGPTYRIVGDDGQVWESTSMVRGVADGE